MLPPYVLLPQLPKNISPRKPAELLISCNETSVHTSWVLQQTTLYRFMDWQKFGMSTASSPSSESTVSPLRQQDGSKLTYFPPLISPLLDAVPEHFNPEGGDINLRRRSVGSISFHEAQTQEDSPPTWGGPKHRKGRIRTSSPPAPRQVHRSLTFLFRKGHGHL